MIKKKEYRTGEYIYLLEKILCGVAPRKRILIRMQNLRSLGVLPTERTEGAGKGAVFYYSKKTLVIVAIGNILYEIGFGRSFVKECLEEITRRWKHYEDPPSYKFVRFAGAVEVRIDIKKLKNRMNIVLGQLG